jgi:signal transduction histidine kinase
MNRPRRLEPRVVRIGCLTLAIIYCAMAVLRYVPEFPIFAVLRGAVALQGFVGVLLAGRFSFVGFRVYSVILALLLSLGGGYVAAALGNDPKQLPLTGLATFIGLVFLQTGKDVALVVPLLLAGHALLLAWMPPTHVGLTPVIVMVVSAIASGAVSALLLVSANARLQESLRWWRDACERERAALQVKTEFLNTMSHELRSPLHVIIGYAEMLQDEVAAAQRSGIDRIRGSAVELLQLVQNTMNAARLEAGKLELNVETVDLSAALRELADDVAALPEAKAGVPVRWRVASDLPIVRLDRLKLKEVVQNLVSNALKFTPRGEVTVAASVHARVLEIEVRDTGPGIPPEARGRIFEMFERVEGDGDRGPAGVGLGLYITRSLVKLMDGTIALQSEAGKGTCFTVRLPFASASTAAAPNASASKTTAAA